MFNLPSTLVFNNATTFEFEPFKYVKFPNYFQGYAFFDDWNDADCPLESISRVSPFAFEDETQILLLWSSFSKNHKRIHPCQWQFTAPKGYSFKLLIDTLSISDTTHLIIEARDHIISE